MPKKCELDERLDCIDCKLCENPSKINLGEYVLALIDEDIEKAEDSIRVFAILTHYTKAQEKRAYETIFKLKQITEFREGFKELMEL